MSESVTEDYYATLGVDPRSEAAVIRAAYLALMRVYHPDKNDSPAAIERAHAIIAAFAVLGDVEKRLRYDWARRRAAEAAAQPQRWRFGNLPRGAIGAALVLLLLVSLSLIRFPVTVRDPPVRPTTAAAVVKTDSTHISKGDAVARPRVAVAAMAGPPPPPPVAVVAPVSTERRVAIEPRPSVAELPLVAASATRVLPPRARPEARKVVRAERPPASASTKCRAAKPGAEAAICKNDNLAALDRNVVAFYNQSLMFGAETKRGALLDSRNNFLARREACRSNACLQSVHLGHLREISTIVEKRPTEPPR